MNFLTTLIEFINSYVGALVALLSVSIAWFTLRRNHDWNRRSCALQLVNDWNQKTGGHRRVIESKLPGLFDSDKRANQVTEITQQIARTIYSSKPGDEHWETRFHLIELGNHFECIATAYLNGIADEKIIKTSFKGPIIKWHGIMKNFINEVKEQRGYDPWLPWNDVVNKWSITPIRNRLSTDRLTLKS
jgi:hypothetical protein